MSLETLAAGFTLRARDQVSPVLTKVGRAFKTLGVDSDRLRAGFSKMGQGLRGMANMGAGLALTMGLSANKVAKFEEQVSVVESVLGRAAPGFDELKIKMKELGATTVFTATQAAEGAEFLSRAGFTATEQLEALAGTLDAAAAEAIPLGTAANIVANNVRAFGLEAKEATRVADVMARTAARTNTDMIQLGEALKYAAPEARALGVDIETAAFSMGVLANSGLQGTIGGTAFKNMLVKLGRPTEAVKKQLNELGIEFQDANNDMLPFETVVKNIAKGMNGMQGNLTKTAFLTDFLGIRGKAAAQVLTQLASSSEEDFDKLASSIRNADGAAKEMAEIRLDNLRGAFTLLGSAMEGLQIELWEGSLGGAASQVRLFADMISVVVVGLQQTEKIMNGGTTPALDDLRARLGPMTDSLLQVSFGIRDGLNFLSRMTEKVRQLQTRLGAAFGSNADWARGIAKFATIAAPMIAVMSTIFIVGGLMLAPFIAFGSGILLVAKATLALTAGMLAGFMAVKTMMMLTAEDGQSFGSRFLEVFRTVEFFVRDFVSGFKAQLPEIMIPFRHLIELGKELLSVFDPVLESLGIGMSNTAEEGRSLGASFALYLGGVLQKIAYLVGIAVGITSFIVKNFVNPMILGIGQVVTAFVGLLSGTMTLGDGLKMLFKGMALSWVSVFLAPVRAGLDLMIKLGEKLGGKEAKLGRQLRGFLSGDPGTLLGMNKKTEKKKPIGPQQPSALDRLLAQTTATTQAKTEANKPPPINLGDQKVEVNANLDNKMCVDGKAMNVATSRSKIELSERMGRSQNPRQRSQIISNGDLPAETR